MLDNCFAGFTIGIIEILVFYYYCICIYYSNNMTALVAFFVLNSVHTKNGVYGWTGLELLCF